MLMLVLVINVCDYSVWCREEALLLLQRPLSQQLELLHLWHAALSTYLASFLQQFKEAGGRVMVAAGEECNLKMGASAPNECCLWM